eukprot:CAMPEP_0115598092 /NCGR_PEP_ID=MMETSP0272-20121206/13695_1 /TAXON_ID=71861 /ORGANISM="Scrippsiella trochoidea, Strain CCMP3099" /LENGTH=99 /DNA_ID=CAMNT_0003033495 /DNA_START=1179 /DNA_END=1475 /DNA_ORIENTATION=+
MEKRLGLIGVGLEGNRWPRASCGAFLPSSEAKVATAARSECKTALRRSGHLEQRQAPTHVLSAGELSHTESPAASQRQMAINPWQNHALMHLRWLEKAM